MTPAEKLKQHIENNTLTRDEWTGKDSHGRETACLLAAMSDDVAARKTASACPAEIMPKWLAHLTPLIDDKGTLGHWPDVVRRYADLAGRWHALDAAGWRRADYRARLAALRIAREYSGASLAVVDAVIALCERVIAGDEPRAEEWAAAEAAAAEASVAAWARAAGTTAGTWAAEEAAADRIIDGVLDGLEIEIKAAEARK